MQEVAPLEQRIRKFKARRRGARSSKEGRSLPYVGVQSTARGVQDPAPKLSKKTRKESFSNTRARARGEGGSKSTEWEEPESGSPAQSMNPGGQERETRAPGWTPPTKERRWKKWLVHARRRRIWYPKEWGPPPNASDTRVPPHLVRPPDGDGWEMAPLDVHRDWERFGAAPTTASEDEPVHGQAAASSKPAVGLGEVPEPSHEEGIVSITREPGAHFEHVNGELEGECDLNEENGLEEGDPATPTDYEPHGEEAFAYRSTLRKNRHAE
jgi:hypothetical protein